MAERQSTSHMLEKHTLPENRDPVAEVKGPLGQPVPNKYDFDTDSAMGVSVFTDGRSMCTFSTDEEDSPRADSGASQVCGGYDCEFVTPPPVFLQTECPSCILKLRKPMQTNCGHTFCKTCIEQVQEEKCPVCKETKFTIFHDKRSQKLLNNLQVHCTHQKIGCGWTGELGKLDGHLETECKFHSLGSEQQFRHLTEKQHKTHSPQLLNIHHFTMKKFELHKGANAEWYSNPFYTHPRGYKFCVRIDANGYKKQRGTHVSLFICLMKGEYDDELSWPFHGEITVELLDQNAGNSREGMHHKCTIHYDDSSDYRGQRVVLGEKRLAGKGESQFIPHSKLHPDQDSTVQYLKDDCLEFRVSVSHGSTKLQVDKKALETALEKDAMMPLCIAQCMTVGAPQTGKSSLKRRLLKQTNQLNMSTGVAEKSVVCAVTVDGSEWTVLEWEDEGAQFLRSIEQQPSKENDAVKEPEQVTVQSVNANTDSAVMESDISLNEPEPRSYSDFIDNILDVGSEKWIAAKKRLENQCTIYFTDTGGQLEFQEVLPAIISGPSIFLLVFSLEHAAKGLDKEFPAVYKRSDGSVYEPPPGISTFTVRDIILHVLASIQATRSYHFQKDGNDQVIEAKVLLVGTHSDCVTDASVRNQIESDVQDLLRDTPYYQKGMLQVPCRKQPNEKFVYMVNNESSEDSVFQEIREKVRSLIFKEPGDSDYKKNISAHWLGFDLMLRWPEKSQILTYEHCADLANRCGIKEGNVKQALAFLHQRFGIIRYFKGEGLGDIVITNPQVIYDVLSDLIAEKFYDGNSNCRLNPEQVKEFRSKGLISEAAIECITVQRSETPGLSLQFLLSLLSHLHIIVKLEGDEDDPETKYFMPCVLAGTIHDLSTPADNSEPSIADLLIVFDLGRQYCPKGLFSVLAIKLAQKTELQEAKYTWILNREKLGRERVVFHVKVIGPRCRYRYTVHIQHGLVGSRSVLRIFVEKLRNRPSCIPLCPKNLESVCKEIRNSVKSAIKSSLDELHKCTKLYIGFYSTCEMNQTSSKNHIAIIEDLFQQHSGLPQDMTCIDCSKEVYPLEEKHEVWFKEVPQELDPQPQALPSPPPLLSQDRGTARPRTGVNLESVDGTTVLGEDNLRDVRSAVVDLAGRWQELGDSLGIRLGDLEAILSASAHSPSNCLRKVLTSWLRQNYKVERFGKPTWRRLVAAVEDHVGGNNLALAQTIAREHPAQESPPSPPH